MTGLIGALVALALVLAILLVLAVRPHVRRLEAAAAALRADTSVGVQRLRALRPARSTRAGSVRTGAGPGRHRRVTSRS